MHDLELSVVVPCYNEAEGIDELYRRVTAVCRAAERSYEFMLVNDGSSDATWHKILALCETDPHVVGINLARNHGHQLALTAGLSRCRGEAILILDADLQDPPELLPRMFEMMRSQKADVVYGERKTRAGESVFKRLTAFCFYRLIDALTDIHIPKDSGDFRLVTHRVIDVFNRMPERHRFTRGMISWIGFRQIPITYDRDPRFAGSTKYPLRKMIRFALDGITAFSTRPLQLANYCGFIMVVVSLLLGLFSVISWLSGSTIAGWTSLMMVVTVIGAAQFLVLGVFAEYLGRIYEQAKGRPLFIIDEVVGGAKTTSGPQHDDDFEAPAGPRRDGADSLTSKPS
jgi:polyisoprenyl-phosphate glycosyltransferase